MAYDGPPLRVLLYDGNFQQIGTVGDPKYVTVIPAYNEAGSAAFGVRANHRRILDLVTPGTRAVFKDGRNDTLFSGPITGYRSAGPEKGSVIEFDVADDFKDVFSNVLGWVVPNAAITAQGSGPLANWTMTGPLETVLKAAVKQNAVDRLGMNLVVPASQGRGPTVKAKLRFNTLYDRFFPVVDGLGASAGDVGFRVIQDGDHLLLQTWVPQAIPQVLSEESGVVNSWSYNRDYPTVSRVVVGGAGEGKLRMFRERVGTSTETAMGRKMEVFRDAKDVSEAEASELYERADETLAEGSRKAGLAVELAETANFKYRSPMSDELRGISVGDTATLALGVVTITDRLQEVTLSWTADGGFISRPRIGDRSDDPDLKLAKTIREIVRSIKTRLTGV